MHVLTASVVHHKVPLCTVLEYVKDFANSRFFVNSTEEYEEIEDDKSERQATLDGDAC